MRENRKFPESFWSRFKFQFKVYLWTAIVLLGLAALARVVYASTPQQIAIVGLDKNGREVENLIPFAEYRSTMGAVFSSVNDSILPALQDQAAVSSSQPGAMKLQTIGVGVSLSGSIGLGPIFNLSGFGRLRLIFSNSSQPVYPD